VRKGYSGLAPGPFCQVVPDIAHELGLQLLGAEFAADVKSTLLLRYLLVPRAKVKHGLIELTEGRPHQPPTIGFALEHAAVWTSTPIEGIGRVRIRTSLHQELPWGIKAADYSN
jgi:hypothetical protein